MKRKRFIKLIMADGNSRNRAAEIARTFCAFRVPYAVAYSLMQYPGSDVQDAAHSLAKRLIVRTGRKNGKPDMVRRLIESGAVQVGIDLSTRRDFTAQAVMPRHCGDNTRNDAMDALSGNMKFKYTCRNPFNEGGFLHG